MRKRQIDIGRLAQFRDRCRAYAKPSTPMDGARCDIRNEGGGISELYIYGGISWDEITAKDVASALAKVNGATIRVRMNSPGGDVFDGIAIYNLLAQRSERVEVWIDSIAASIASVIAMAGDEISIAANAQIMIHRAWGIVAGHAGEVRDFAALLEQLENAQLIPSYARTGLSTSTLAQMMAAETWMDADTAVSKRFADKILAKNGTKAMVRPGQFARMPAAARAGGSSREDDRAYCTIKEHDRVYYARLRDEIRARLRDTRIDASTRQMLIRQLTAMMDD